MVFKYPVTEDFILQNFIVTHNTNLGIFLTCQLGLKTVLLCHIDVIKPQWKSDFEQFTNLKVQIVENEKNLDPKYDVYIMGIIKASKMDEMN